jgi:hypothetical protein
MKTNLAQIPTEEYHNDEGLHIHVHVVPEQPKIPWYKMSIQQEMLYQMLLSVLTFFVLIICSMAVFGDVYKAQASNIITLSSNGHAAAAFSPELATVLPKAKTFFEDKCLAPILGLGLSLTLMVGYHWFKWWIKFIKKKSQKKVAVSPN